MAINNHSNIRSETNFKGQWFDAEQFQVGKAAVEHGDNPDPPPWSQSYKPREVPWEDTAPAVEPDEELTKANRKDLFIRSITPSTESK